MTSLLPFVVIGLTTGAIYGLAGTGLVLTYQTSGIFNFAHGAVATVATYVLYVLNVDNGLPELPAALISVFVVGPIVGVLLELIARRLARTTTVFKIAGMLGIVLLIQGLADAWFGTTPVNIPAFLPQQSVTLPGQLLLGTDQIIIIALSVVSVIGLYLFLRRSVLGLSMRAVVDDPDLLDSQGVNPVRIRRIAWVIGSTFAAGSGVLLAPSVGLNALLLTMLVVQAFGAAAFGAFTSLPLTYLGGLIIGIASAVVDKFVTSGGIIAGLPPSIPFILLFLVLILIPKRALLERRVSLVRPVPQWRAPARAQAVGAAAVLVVLIAVPLFADAKLPVYTSALCYGLLFLSLGLLVRMSGQVSLAHAGFAAVGAAAFSHLAHDVGLPWLIAVLLAGLVVVPVGAFIAIPAIRLSGLYLALATLGFGIVLEQIFYTSGAMFGQFTAGVPAPRPHLSWLSLDSDKGYYYVVLVALLLAAGTVVGIGRCRLGRMLSAMRDSPLALSTLGVSLNPMPRSLSGSRFWPGSS